ncbi:YppG family protein [Virgibacillus sp. C22-A2]|uniref:YppG family protein n=1 Tax=Virgibacillus tibetensis TaxID=3042313 RepID=A0ABU6KHP9_9BACI|nr:YppG family protein [Virgibacillus sp. C22-A2]
MYNRPYYEQSVHPGFPYLNQPYTQQPYNTATLFNGPANHQTPYEQFAKPQQPTNWPDYMQTNAYYADLNYPLNKNPDYNQHYTYQNANLNPHSVPNQNPNPFANPNPNPSINPNPSNGLMSYFQSQDGQVDFDKMLSTVGQLANTYHQVSPIVKQFGALMKNFR